MFLELFFILLLYLLILHVNFQVPFLNGFPVVVSLSAVSASHGRMLESHTLGLYPIPTTEVQTPGVAISKIMHSEVQEPLPLRVHSTDGEKICENWYFLCTL